ncbi:hypothetical protein BDY19DRAFT_665510 [Irpex rosettiformis]|uniref:Uncharacterized protein n=1 Tax=Irpex rosettiformis TaxID=378272 RepID=A0ACB8U9T3_9APHY|nr:hypothetical protein BDY19DRAFT_665510 [Irpex rosettiformis]
MPHGMASHPQLQFRCPRRPPLISVYISQLSCNSHAPGHHKFKQTLNVQHTTTGIPIKQTTLPRHSSCTLMRVARVTLQGCTVLPCRRPRTSAQSTSRTYEARPPSLRHLTISIAQTRRSSARNGRCSREFASTSWDMEGGREGDAGNTRVHAQRVRFLK